MPTRLKISRTGEIVPDLNNLEQSLHVKGFEYIAGVDEAGRGPLAGPVVAAAVIIPPGVKIDGICDSKKLTPARRSELFDIMINSDVICSVGVIDNDDIDKFNILKASLLAMRKAVTSLNTVPQFVLVDGVHAIPNIITPQLTVIDGDALCCSISAASIVAKVTRDRIMDRYQKLYPEYSFSCHRGYPTPQHLEELRSYGPTDIHRKSFRPVNDILNKNLINKS
jgi:ribonuclease HII